MNSLALIAGLIGSGKRTPRRFDRFGREVIVGAREDLSRRLVTGRSAGEYEYEYEWERECGWGARVL